MVKQQHQLFVVLLCLVDALVATGACYAAWVVRRLAVEPWWPERWDEYVKEPMAFVVVPVSLYALRAFGLYRPRRDRSLWNEQAQIIKAGVASVAASVVVLWAVGSGTIWRDASAGPVLPGAFMLDQGRVQFGALALLLPLFLGVHRALFRSGLRVIRAGGWNLRHAAVVGTGRLGQITCRTLDRNSWTGIQVRYFISHHDLTRREECVGRPVHGGLRDLERVLDEQRVDAVYLAIPTSRASAVPGVLQRLEKFPVDVRIIPDVSPRFVPQSMAVSELDGMPVLSYRENPQHGLGGLSKRGLDLLGSAGGLIVFAPVMLAAALAVRLSSPGPVIFRQRRVSLGGEVFNIYKFRTMYHVEDEERPAAWTERSDPRVTAVGRWLRRTSLDELPQLFNVLRGDMSLVGPRPERPELIARFREDWRGYMLRQHVKAGMTGWAQVNGLRGQTSLRKRLQYDLFYVRHWSLWFDVRILWLTLFRGFLHRNAH